MLTPPVSLLFRRRASMPELLSISLPGCMDALCAFKCTGSTFGIFLIAFSRAEYAWFLMPQYILLDHGAQ